MHFEGTLKLLKVVKVKAILPYNLVERSKFIVIDIHQTSVPLHLPLEISGNLIPLYLQVLQLLPPPPINKRKKNKNLDSNCNRFNFISAGDEEWLNFSLFSSFVVRESSVSVSQMSAIQSAPVRHNARS